jgi:phosphoadenosine phosphosulfate reductase
MNARSEIPASALPLPARVDRARRLLAGIEKNYSPSVFASGFGAEDMVVLDLIARDGLALPIFLVDTGRLPPETLALVAHVRKRYGLDIATRHPWPGTVDAFVEASGIDGFYDSIEARKGCCEIRKREPLRRALQGKRGWITGLRREQSPARAAIAETELDPVHGIWRFSPLADWTHGDVWAYLRAHRVPYNALHDRGYASIGCEPCTRATRPDEHPRAGRWWWEQDGARPESRLHAIPVRVLESA